jgi:hypothetical protein
LAAFLSFVTLQLDPKGVGIVGHVVVKHSTPVVADHEIIDIAGVRCFDE